MSQINARSVLKRFRDNNWELGKDFLKVCRVKKRVDVGDRERVLDDVYGTWVTVRSCCEKRFEKKLCKRRKILRLS